MIKLAIIGFGNHVIKNILPAISRLDFLEIDAIYVRDTEKYFSKAKEYGLKLKNIVEPIDEIVQWVYISTPISTHFELTKKYLELNKHVICEKPLTNNFSKTEELFEIAKNKGLRLYEVSMYKYHKQYKHLEKFVNENRKQIKVVKTSFTIPHLDENDIRYKKDLDGGALLDVGYYPLSIITSLFGKPNNMSLKSFTEKNYEVDLFGTVLFDYDSFYCIGEWGIGLPYTNEITVITEKKSLRYERIFSKPETFITKVQVTEGFDTSEIEIGKDDQFVNMFNEIILNKQEIPLNSNMTKTLSRIING